MNIHIKDADFALNLMETAIHRVEIGSKMYGNSNENSDTDILYVLPIPEDFLGNPLRSHHQLQYKCSETNTDHLFTFLDDFIKNTLTGDSTINFEVWQNIDKNQNGLLSPLGIFNKDLVGSYSIMKAYLGFAKRDIKYFDKAENIEAKVKKLGHIDRGIEFFQRMLECYYGKINFSTNYSFKHDPDLSFEKYLNYYSYNLEKLRTKLNLDLDKRRIKFLMNTDVQMQLTIALDVIKKKDTYLLQKDKIDKLSVNLLTKFYEVNENGIKY